MTGPFAKAAAIACAANARNKHVANVRYTEPITFCRR